MMELEKRWCQPAGIISKLPAHPAVGFLGGEWCVALEGQSHHPLPARLSLTSGRRSGVRGTPS